MPQTDADPIPGVTLVRHPIIAHMLTELRDRHTPSPAFRETIGIVGQFLAYEALRRVKLADAPIDTPLEPHTGKRLAQRITVVPVLRAGLGLADRLLSVIPGAYMGHIGMFRDEEKLEPVSYYEKLPRRASEGMVLLIDPMLATGGSAVAAATLLKKRGCHDITFVCLLAAPEGIDTLRQAHPDVPIITAAIDRQLNDLGYILPGLGDAGDRVFGTTE